MTMTPGAAAPALKPDPVIDWLTRCRDFSGTTPDARELAQRAIDQLTHADEPTVDDVIQQLLQDMGSWRFSRGCVVSDRAGGTQFPHQAAEDIHSYGGYLVGESMSPKAAIAIARLPQLIDAASATPQGREVLAEMALELTTPSALRPVADRLDGSLRIHRLADEFQSAQFEGVAELLRAIAASLMDRTTPALASRIYGWLEANKKPQTF